MDIYFMVCLMRDGERKAHRMRSRLHISSGSSCRQKDKENSGKEGLFED